MNKKGGLIVLLFFAGLAIVLCLKLFCSNGRYQIAFGNIQKEYTDWGRHEGEQTENQVVPVCFKIDTFTGRCWIYVDNFTLTATEKTMSEEGFKRIPKYTHELPR